MFQAVHFLPGGVEEQVDYVPSCPALDSYNHQDGKVIYVDASNTSSSHMVKRVEDARRKISAQREKAKKIQKQQLLSKKK